ncbi:FAD-dependent oxidoreductase [Caballeronia sordidicola]|uniref:FAD-dependent oxidoreductase n=1 Tax=Caballeronia sordidicola TaxID=196367 RepID=UPI0004CFF768|nr:FAD-dependent oxidoreductase [Caballeronia sordidicola]
MDPWDVIVIGSGAAGLVAAWHARAAGANVLVVNKSLVGRSGATITSGGGVSVSGRTAVELGFDANPDDTDEIFFSDTIRSGSFLSDQRLVAAMVEGVGDELRRLIADGAKISAPKHAPGHSSGRGVRIPGPSMQRVVTTAALRAGVRFREDFQSTDLLTRDGAVIGVAGLDRRTGVVEALHGRAVVIATGGATSNWSLRTAPEELSGDGHAMALATGADLIEMEMLQFLPCCLVAPDMWRGLQFPWILGPQSGVRAWLLNRYGERFMARWDPERMELATRDVVAAASAAEVFEGRGSPNGGVYLSWAHLPRDIVDNFTQWSRSFSTDWRWEGFDMTPLVERIRAGYAIEVAPAAHFSLGGIRVDVDGSTGVPHLYACGEATGGVHGGNRLSGNAGAQVLVQGKTAGRSAAALALSRSDEAVNLVALEQWRAVQARIKAPFERTDGIAPFDMKRRLGQLVDSALGAVRDGAGLAKALDEVRGISGDDLSRLACRNRDAGWNRDWSDALECMSALPVIESALLSALARTGSLGAHRRHDRNEQAVTAPLEHGLISRQAGSHALLHRAEPVRFPFLALA